MSKEVTVYGYNSVETSVLKNPENIIELYIDESSSNKRIEKLISGKAASRLNILKVSKRFLSQLLSTEKHQGIAAKIRIDDYFDLKSSIDYLSQTDGSLILILDDLDDPRNIGACYRTANAVGVDMVVVSKNRISLNSPVISKVSSGAFELTNTAIVSNIAQFIGKLKKNGFWIYGSSDTANKDYREIEYESSTVIVIGSEGKGMRDLTAKKCDDTIRIPMKGQVESLNVSVACGVVLYEVLRQRDSF